MACSCNPCGEPLLQPQSLSRTPIALVSRHVSHGLQLQSLLRKLQLQANTCSAWASAGGEASAQEEHRADLRVLRLRGDHDVVAGRAGGRRLGGSGDRALTCGAGFGPQKADFGGDRAGAGGGGC